ncbi:MAG TPA: hypothetical protein VHZ50_15800, partial [Puia sp.]|nr:hypothetical protein [Puia sp.]
MRATELNEYIHVHYDSASKKVTVENITCSDPFFADLDAEVKISFNNCIFEKEFCFTGAPDQSEIIFNRCMLNGELQIYGSKASITYKILFSQIKNGFSIDDSENISLFMGQSQGNGEFRFDNTKFNSCSFAGFSFNELTHEDSASFRNCVFKSSNFRDTVLSNPSFNNSIFITDATFDRSVLNHIHGPGSGNFFN